MRQATLGFVGFVVGCASYSAAPVSLLSPDKYPTYSREEGLSIGARAYDGTDETVAVLGEDVTESFTPVHISMQCTIKDRFVINRARLRLVCSDGSSLRPVAATAMYAEYKHDVAGAAMGGGVVGGASASDANDAMKTDWTEKEFASQILLGPNQRLGGFVYFRGRCPKGPRTLKLTAERLKAGDEVTLQMDLSAASPVAAGAPVEEVAKKPTGRPTFGPRASLLGANSYFSGGLALEWPPSWIGATTSRWLETALTVGYRSAEASTVGATAAIKATTFMFDARIWLGRTHAFLLNVATGLTVYDLTASDLTGKYKRQGSPGVTVLGLGYGYRSATSPFRFALLGGALLHTGDLKPSTGTLSPSTMADLDNITDKITTPQLHLEISFGLMF